MWANTLEMYNIYIIRTGRVLSKVLLLLLFRHADNSMGDQRPHVTQLWILPM